MNEPSQKPDLPAELDAFEQSLNLWTIQADSESIKRTKERGLERLKEFADRSEDAEPILSGEKLAEAIVFQGEQKITLSLRQYVNSVRYTAAAIGLMAGLILGSVVSAVAIYSFTDFRQPRMARDADAQPTTPRPVYYKVRQYSDVL